ncbi:MAG: twin-arginine translocase TatA/TatE family subunit [Candidatus Nezhaarchaeota archaeon]|nr:twin-arginine translocase TatA/TatE family subunit [Candidatus Nezhaarchaeota archaeon]
MIGAAELLVLFFIALLLFGPKKIPEMARVLGEAIREFRRASTPAPPLVKKTRDEELLLKVARELGIEVEGKDVDEVARAIVETARQRQELKRGSS